MMKKIKSMMNLLIQGNQKISMRKCMMKLDQIIKKVHY